jgi:hypothetical protein
MHGRKAQSIAALSAASLVAQPFFALPRAQACPVSAVEADLSPRTISGSLSRFAAAVGTNSPGMATLVPVMLVPAAALSTAAIETQRGAIAEIMVELGEDHERARQMATELSADDLAVLLANPKMMQKAGDSETIIVAALIVGGIVALALAADSGSIMISS